MTKTHEIKLDGYGAHTTLAEDRPIMLLGTAESYGIEMLHVVHGESWEGLTVTATFNAPDGTSTDMLMSADGSITVPSEATTKSGSGKIVFSGVSEGVQRISCDLEYFVVAHSSINGAQSGGTAPSWFEQAATRFMPPGGTAGQVLTKLTNTDFDAGWQDSQGGAGLAPLIGTTQTITPSQVLAAIKAGRDIALQYTDSHYGTFVFSAFNANEQLGIVVSNSILPHLDGLTGTLLGDGENADWLFGVTNTATKDYVDTAVDEALAQAKASGEFDGADGLTPTIGENGNWYLGNTDTGKPSRGEKGDKGDKGDTGATGATGASGAAGKSAYQYAQDGGYTGTEAEFAAKLAREKFANPNALTFTGAVTGSYDGSAPVSVEIPSGGSGLSSNAKNLLITILRSGVYSDNQSDNITALETALGGGTTEPDVPVETTYAISNELINCTSSNSATSVKENAAYSTTLTANDGYTLTGGTVTVTMGGVDITATAYADGVISIAAVTGDVEIFASAVVVQAEAALPEDGLIAYFDFRTTTYDNAGSGGKTTIAPTKGSGQLYMWANNSISAQTEYGLKPANTRTWQYDQNGGTNETALGDAFTVIQLTYGEVPAFGFNYSTLPPLWAFRPQYINTSGSTTWAEKIDGSNFNSDSKGDYNFTVVRADGATLTEIFDTSRTTYNGGDIDGFSRWLDTPGGNLVTKGDTTYCTAMAIYNRVLTDSEIEEAREFMKTLEVTA